MRRHLIMSAVLAAGFAACGPAEENNSVNNTTSNNTANNTSNNTTSNNTANNTTSNNTANNTANAANMMEVSIPFNALVGAEAFSCETEYMLGSVPTPAVFTNAKLYISEVSTFDMDGNEVAVELVDDDLWQNGTVALLDFEDATANCDNGTAELNDTVVGMVPEGEYAGLAFTIGIPFEENHQDVAVAETPLNLAQMFWNWQGGYKFIRIDGLAETDGGFKWHLGSTGCMEEETNVVTSCANPNRPRVDLPDYAMGDAIDMDISAFFVDVDMTPDMEGNSANCQSNPMHTDCESIFATLELPFGENTPAPQTIFTVAE